MSVGSASGGKIIDESNLLDDIVKGYIFSVVQFIELIAHVLEQ